MLKLFSKYPEYSRRSLKRHIPAAILDGFLQGVAVLFVVIARKNLNAGDLIITLLTSAPIALYLVSNIFALKMIGKPKQPFLIAAAFIGRFLLLTIFFVEDASLYAIIILISAIGPILYKPAENSILQANYDKSYRGKIYGVIQGFMLFSMMISAYFGGKILDAGAHNYQYLIPVGGLLGFFAYLIYAYMPVRKMEYQPQEEGGKSLLEPYKNFFNTLIKDKQFGRFELCFLIYGTAIIMLEPLLIILFVDELNADYSQAATALGLVGQLTLLLATPIMGRLFDGSEPFKMFGQVLLVLVLFSVTLYFASDMRIVYFAFVLRGVAMSAVIMLWNLGPINFAGEKDSSNYMGVHMTLTGVRGVLAPFIGMGSFYLIGLRNAFLVSAALFLVAAIMSFRFRKLGGSVQSEGAVSVPAPATLSPK